MFDSARTITVGGHTVSLGWARVGEVDPQTLPSPERALLSARATQTRRAQFAAGRASAREALRGLAVDPGHLTIVRRSVLAPDAGRPLVADAAGTPLQLPLALSVTHSGEWACAAAMVGPQRIGIDLELAAPPDTPHFEEEAFAPGEVSGFERFEARGLRSRTAAWTLKEAALKVWGVGLRAVLPRVRLIPEDLSPDGPGGLAFACALEVGAQPAHLPPPPRRLTCVFLVRGEGVLAVAIDASGS